jgi:hypothetical protein
VGDRVDFHHHLQHAIYLSGADLALTMDEVSQELEELPTIDDQKPIVLPTLPDQLNANEQVQENLQAFNAFGGAISDPSDHMGRALRCENDKQAIRSAVSELETILDNPDFYDSHARNTAISVAVSEISTFATEYRWRSYQQPEKLELLRYAAGLARFFDLNEADTADLEPGFNAYSALEAATISTPGKTLAIHNQSARAFTQIAERLAEETYLSEAEQEMATYSKEYIALIRRVQTEIIARSFYLPFKWIKNDPYISGAAAPTKGERTRPNRVTQLKATEKLKPIALD